VDPRQDIQVLTPMHRGPIGAQALNGALQAVLNPPRSGLPELVRGGRTFRVGDRVMQIRNNYERGPVFNGDLGRVVGINPEEHEVLVEIDGAVVRYAYPDLDELVHAYATTIHKSQGSEFPIVVVVCSTQHYILLVRNLLYTAITRAKRHLVLVGTAKAVAIAARTASTRQRHSALPERLAALIEDRPLPDCQAGPRHQAGI
jgi:exodeoxyribonuclease V alpha subunit